jgi:hypothetical protein
MGEYRLNQAFERIHSLFASRDTATDGRPFELIDPTTAGAIMAFVVMMASSALHPFGKKAVGPTSRHHNRCNYNYEKKDQQVSKVARPKPYVQSPARGIVNEHRKQCRTVCADYWGS